jgi:diguanylate cyclase (GGDEF)-like protein/PAS domain S-box-containing protein
MKNGWMAVCLGLLLAVGWVSSPSADHVEPVHIGILNYQSKPVMGTQWQDFEDLLNQRLPQYHFKILLKDNQALDEAVASRQVDFVLTHSGNYVNLNHHYGLSSPLATIVRNHKGSPLRAYGGVIFARSDRDDINGLEDLGGQRIATIGTAGFAGYQIQAQAVLRSTGALPTPSQLLITGQPQGKVIDAVLAGEADLGFVRSGLIERLVSIGRLQADTLKVLNQQNLPGYPFKSSTWLYPEWPIAAMPHTDRTLTNQVASALFALSAGGSPATDRIWGFEVPQDYLVTEELLRELRAPPFDHPIKVTAGDIWSSYRPQTISVIVVASVLVVLVVLLSRLSLALKYTRDQAEQEQQRLANIIWGTGAGTWEWDIQSGEVFLNERAIEMLGYEFAELQPLVIEDWVKHVHRDDQQRVDQQIRRVFARLVGAYQAEKRVRHKNGDWVWLLDRGKVSRWSKSGKALWMSGTFIDITDKKLYEKQLEGIATIDSLTGLSNRLALTEKLELMMSEKLRHEGFIAIVFLDLNDFKPVNDTYGHDVGDQLLVAIAERLKACMREEDIVARLGGDEFVIVINSLSRPGDCEPQVRRLLEAAQATIRVDDIDVGVSASAGITIYPQQHNVSIVQLFRQADLAMYKAKYDPVLGYAYANQAIEILKNRENFQEAMSGK